jgi:D-alanine-D-alanine ligase-like ATP-grasp enzyme
VRVPFVPRLLARIAKRAGVRIELEPEFEFAGRIIFPDGNTHVFRAGDLNINRAGSVAIADDKSYTSYFLKQAGLRVPRELTFFSEFLAKNLAPDKRRSSREACEFADVIGYPVIVKPNDGSFGAFVVKAYRPDDIVAAAKRIFAKHDVALVQEFLPGNDYRIVVLGDEIISAYQRIGLNVVGDGASTIEELLVRKKRELAAHGRPNTEVDLSDSRIDHVLNRNGLSRTSILPKDIRQVLLDNANLSTGGDAIDITPWLHPTLAEVAVKASRAVGLSLCGVDVMCADATKPSTDYTILELNPAPGLDNYAAVGEAQSARVEELFLKILGYLEKNHN